MAEFIRSLQHDVGLPLEVRSLLANIGDQFQKKLWHQLTRSIQQLIDLPDSRPFQLDLFNTFVLRFASNINQIQLVQIATKVAEQCPSPSEALDFLKGLIAQVDTPETPEAFVFATTKAALYKLQEGQLDAVRDAISQSSAKLDVLDNTPSVVHASFYKISGEYHKAKAEYSEYYNTSLLYLACIDIDTDIDATEKIQRAHDLAISALLGQTTYNFGELLMHPILLNLGTPENEWLMAALSAFHEGSIGKFEALATYFEAEPHLHSHLDFLRQKICLMALVHLIFKRPAGDRVLPFDVVSVETALPKDEVEHLFMKAMSLKLIAGLVDQVQEQFSVSWIQPRILDRTQIGTVDHRLQLWSENLQETTAATFQAGPELFA